MDEFLGIILFDEAEMTLRIYKISSSRWQLLHFGNQNLETAKPLTPSLLADVITNLLSASYSQKVIDWRICARNIARETVTEVALAIKLPIELLGNTREQELICKGVCTEFW